MYSNKVKKICCEIGCQFGKFENCAGDFQTGMKIAHIVVQFELKKRISA